ncbi:MAG: hypothetical protein CL862_04595 [Cyanobium sp. NAT70]|nr:hypothetical protein [Cyanobium sp. NAT70]
MNRSSLLLWSALLALLLLPTAAGRVLLDVAGGVILVLLALPLVLAGLGWIGWKVLQSKLITCQACGAASFGGSDRCAVCGTPLNPSSSSGPGPQQAASSMSESSAPASEVTIDVTAQDAGSDS